MQQENVNFLKRGLTNDVIFGNTIFDHCHSWNHSDFQTISQERALEGIDLAELCFDVFWS